MINSGQLDQAAAYVQTSAPNVDARLKKLGVLNDFMRYLIRRDLDAMSRVGPEDCGYVGPGAEKYVLGIAAANATASRGEYNVKQTTQ